MRSFLKRIGVWAYRPVKENQWFFFWMFLLGMACILTINRFGKHRAVFELFIDLYLLCAVLSMLPRSLRKGVRGVLYVVFYALAIVDVFCRYRLGSPIGPALVQNVLFTNAREASEALATYVTWRSVCSPVLVVVALLLLHVASAVARSFGSGHSRWHKALRWRLPEHRQSAAGWGCLLMALLCALSSFTNKRFLYYNIIKADTNLESQYYLQLVPSTTEFYLPVYRLMHALNVVRISQNELRTLVARADRVQVDSCSYRSPCIVFIIGESYNRHHSALYGYDKPTTPWQSAMAADSAMTVFTDVVAPFHQTSEVFKLAFSLYGYGEKRAWADYPLFTQLFLKAGYHVSFITNQFVNDPSQDVWDFSAGNIINEPVLSRSQFSDRNAALHTYDEGLLADYDSLGVKGYEHQLVIFHLLGQHVAYADRYPAAYSRFHADDYNRPDLTDADRQVLAEYDNATLYNDEVVRRIVELFLDDEAVVIYMPDHGELCFDMANEGREAFGRSFDVKTESEIRQQFEIPFWIWMSDRYRQRHPDVYERVRAVRDVPFMTDNIDQMLLSLAGIASADYRPDCDPLSPLYDAGRPRMLMGQIRYERGAAAIAPQ